MFHLTSGFVPEPTCALPGAAKASYVLFLAIDKILEKDELGNLEGGFPLVFDAQP
jgi:hypothetical protein